MIPMTSAAAETNTPTTTSVRCGEGGCPTRLTFRRVRRRACLGPTACLSRARGGGGAGSSCLGLFGARLSGWAGPTSCMSGAGAGAGAGIGTGASRGTGNGRGTGAGASRGTGTGASRDTGGVGGTGAGPSGGAGAGCGAGSGGATSCRGRRSGWLGKPTGISGWHCCGTVGPGCSAFPRALRPGRPRQNPCVAGRRSRRPCALLFLGIGSGMVGSG